MACAILNPAASHCSFRGSPEPVGLTFLQMLDVTELGVGIHVLDEETDPPAGNGKIQRVSLGIAVQFDLVHAIGRQLKEEGRFLNAWKAASICFGC